MNDDYKRVPRNSVYKLANSLKEEKLIMSNFDLKLALAGAPVKLRNGTKAFVVADLRTLDLPPSDYPLVVAYTNQQKAADVMSATLDGRFMDVSTTMPLDIAGMWPTAEFLHWDVIDPKWKYIAADKNGRVHLYMVKPYINVNSAPEEWTYSSPSILTAHREITSLLNFTHDDWRTSLVERPTSK